MSAPVVTGHVVLFGSPCSGFRIHGPFPTAEAASRWGEDLGEGGEFVMPVYGAPDASPGAWPAGHALYPWDDKPRPAAELRPVEREFPDFDLAYLPPIPPAWEDHSWHNDAMPFWLANPTTGVFVDYASQELGDYPDLDPAVWRRFHVVPMEDGLHPLDCGVLLWTDDWDEVLELCRSRA